MKNMINLLTVYGVLLIIIGTGILFIKMVYRHNEVEKNPDSWKVHLYSGGKEITTYTTIGRIREHQYNSTISFIDVLSGKEVVISGTFVAEEF